ncbi:MAG TPA: class I SAM-dependent methyltransferase [Humisphaera sp.]|jgi:predicted O-methyltransferase YrrM|nr:class I SAM-dependent methyltransferase [Humisphaera sp.]
MLVTENLTEIADLYRDYPIARTGSGLEFINIIDDYVAYLSFANAGMLNKGNLLCLDYALSHLPSNNPLIEIGIFAGLSTNLIAYYKRRHGVTNRLFNCDRWQFEGAENGGNIGESQFTHAEYRQFVRETYRRNVSQFSRGDLPATVEMLSGEFFTAWEDQRRVTDVFGQSARLGGPISFCYIDGDHRYEAARADFLNADRFLEPGGFILFDDSADGSIWEVTRVIDEVKRMPNYRVVIKNPNYLVQKIAE